MSSPSESLPAPAWKFRIAIAGVIWLVILAVCSVLRPLQLDEVLQLIGTRTEHAGSVFRWLRTSPGSVPVGYVVQWGLLRAAGFSNFIARVPSLVAWMVTAVSFARIATRAGLRRLEALAVMAALTPMLFRYAIEGRPYLPAFCLTTFATLQLIGFIARPEERPSAWQLGMYGASLAIAPLIQGTAVTVTLAHAGFILTDGSMRRDQKRQMALAVAIVLSLMLPVAWSLAMRDAWAETIARVGYTFAFSGRSLYGFLKDLSGGGLVCTGLLFAGAVFGCVRWGAARPVKYLLVLTAFMTVIGALGSDALAGYFTSPRQAIYCLCPLVVLAAAGWQDLLNRYRIPAVAALGLFAVVAAAKDVATVRSKEDWRAASEMVSRAVEQGFCVEPASDLNASVGLYSFFDASLEAHRCHSADTKVALLYNLFTADGDRAAASSALLKRGFVAAGKTAAGGSTVERFIAQSAVH